jgi:hypothetical protein
MKEWLSNWKLRYDPQQPFFGGNYARSSRVFESGFTGFRGLTITSLV